MPRDGTKNLIPQNKRTKDEQKVIAKMGGFASGEARRERKRLRDELLLLLEQGDTQEKLCNALIMQARRGNTKAFEIIRDTIGEKPIDTLESKTELSGHMHVTGDPYDELTTEELRKLARLANEQQT